VELAVPQIGDLEFDLPGRFLASFLTTLSSVRSFSLATIFPEVSWRR
jgi:hypothetical protein